MAAGVARGAGDEPPVARPLPAGPAGHRLAHRTMRRRSESSRTPKGCQERRDPIVAAQTIRTPPPFLRFRGPVSTFLQMVELARLEPEPPESQARHRTAPTRRDETSPSARDPLLSPASFSPSLSDQGVVDSPTSAHSTGGSGRRRTDPRRRASQGRSLSIRRLDRWPAPPECCSPPWERHSRHPPTCPRARPPLSLLPLVSVIGSGGGCFINRGLSGLVNTIRTWLRTSLLVIVSRCC